MKKVRFWSLLVTFIFGIIVCASAKKVHTLGDSTMAPYDESATVTRGWGMYFGNFLTDGWTAVNYAKGGRDTYTGYSELWANAKPNVQAGDYVIISFGHNDEKNGGMDGYQLKAYYESIGDATKAAAVDLRGSIPSTTYKENLGKIVDEVLAKGAIPVVCSPVCRSYFGSDGKIKRNGRHDLGDSYSILTASGPTTGNSVPASDHTMDYAYHSQQLANEKGVAFVDLTTATKELYESYGDSKCHEQLFDGEGSTHFNTTGALLVARLCAQLMKEQGVLADGITVPTDLTISPAEADLGEGYKGQTAIKELTINGFGLTPANGTIAVTATDGIMLSTDKANWQASLSVDYTNSTLVQNIYARVILTNTGKFSGTITATLGETIVEVPLSINIIELGAGDPFTVSWPMVPNDNATTEGNVTATAATLEGLGKYGNVNGYGALIAPDGKTGAWATAGIDDDPKQYVQYAVTAPEGKKLDITNIAMKIKAQGGGSLQCHVYYSTDGFVTRKTIFASGVMTSTWNEINCEDVVTVDEGDRLLIRVYPWSKNVDNGRWVCISDVAVSGQSKDAAGVNISGTISYALDKGGLTQGDDAVMDPTDLGAGFAAKKWTAGSALTVENTVTYESGSSKTVQTRIYNGTGASFAGTATADNTLTLTLTPEDGFTFVPTKVSFEAARYGTDGGNISASAEAGESSVEIASNAAVNRSGKKLDIASFSETINGLSATAENPLKLNFSFLSLGKTKQMGISNLVIEGTLVGAAAQVTKYALNTSVSPADAGTISIDPDMATFKEGTEVTLTATKNFGYKFKEWQDGTGKTVSTEAVTTIKMDAEKTMTAVFETIPVYTVSTKVTNDADRSLGSVTLTPNDHAGKYEAGTVITATAEESKILKFMKWTDANENAGTEAKRTVTVNSDMELVANYEVQDFIAVFDASATEAYDRTGNGFAADLTWDADRNAHASVVKVSDGNALYSHESGTPVVRNRTKVVVDGLNGLYQNGFYTTDIAWQYSFSTKGFTSAKFSGQMAAKNSATKNYKAQYSIDGETFTDIEGATLAITTGGQITDYEFDLPAAAIGQATVSVRITGTGTDIFNKTDELGEWLGLKYCKGSESGVGNVFVLGKAEVEEDSEAPVVSSMLPADNATGVSASGRITISYNERIEAGATDLKASLTAADGTSVSITPAWSSRSVSFDYFALAYGETYTFSMPAGFVQDRSGNKAAAVTLSFTVMERVQPAARTFDAIVDQSLDVDKVEATATMPAQYKKIQDAINDAPSASTRPYLIFIKEGYYNDPNETFNSGYGFRYTNPSDASSKETEQITGGKSEYDECRLVYVNKPNIHLIGQAIDKVTIAGNRLDGGDNSDRTRPWYHVNAGATLEVQAGATDFYMENITVDNENWTKLKKEGPQALAMNISADRAVFNNVNVRSYQDTYYAGGTITNRQFWHKSTIEGGVDFIYGNGCDVFFESCMLNINRKTGGYIVAPSHPDGTRWGYVFNNTTISSTYFTPEDGKVYLGRPWHEHPKTVFLHTQMELGAYEGYWYETMGGIPALWAVYDIWDKNGNKMSEYSIEDYWYKDSSTGETITGKAKNSLTDEEAAAYTLSNVLAGDGTSNAETGVWNPLPVVEQTDAPQLAVGSGCVTWNAVPYAICYVVTVNGKVVAFPTETAISGLSEGDVVSVQAVNEYGALSVMSDEATVLGTTSVVMAASGYTTLVSTEALDFQASGLEAYIATEVNDVAETVTLTEITSAPANTPVVLKGTPGKSYDITVTASPAALPAINLLAGSATETTILTEGTAYLLSGGKFFLNNAGVMPAGKAYLPKRSDARELTVIFGETTGIGASLNEKGEMTNEKWYTLEGRLLQGKPMQKGVYVHNKLKVVIK